MRRVILAMQISTDGFVMPAEPRVGWPLDYFDDELDAYELELLGQAGVHAMGRVSYEEMAPHWQASTGPLPSIMNDIPKAVFSHSMQRATWPESTIHREVETGIAELKAQDGGPVVVHGGAGLVQQLTRLGLVDEYRLNIHPVAFGQGLPLFGGTVDLELQEVQRFPRGTLACTYTPRT
jgi:dihydrofolate reductase